MAEKEVLFEDNMETQAQDFNNLQDYIGNSIDHLVVDAIDSGNAYTGMTVTKAAATQVSISIGRLYWGGFVYVLEDPVIIDFQSIAGAMPVTQQRQIAIVAWGSTIQTDTQPRNFVVDADTGQAQPESVSMTSIRLCNVGPIPGVEASSPNYPAVPATNLLIAYVLMAPSGVVSIQQIRTTQLPNMADHEARIGMLEAEFGLAENQIVTLQTALAALAAQLANYVTLTMFQKLVDLVNQIWLIVNKPPPSPPYLMDSVDNFFDTSQSAVGTNVDGAYNANISEGIRFSSGSTSSTKLNLFNPNEPTIQAWDTFILPKPSGTRIRMDCTFEQLDWVAESCLNHPYWVFTPRRLGWARERFRCGFPFLPAPQPAVWAYGGIYDPIYVNLQFGFETWVVVPNYQIVQYPAPSYYWPRYSNLRLKYYWNDFVDVWYWNKTFINYSYSHNIMGQSFLNSQDGWLSGITLFSMVPRFLQPIRLFITACDEQGVPDHQQTLAHIDLDASAVAACYDQPIQVGDILTGAYYMQGSIETFGYPIWESGPNGYFKYIPVYAYPFRINFTPVFLAAGQRYSFHVATTYGHQFAVSLDPSCYGIHQGDFWDYDGANWFRVGYTGYKSLRFRLHYLVWGQYQGNRNAQGAGNLRYTVQLQPLSLAGTGIAGIDVLADHIVPPATDLSYAIQLPGQSQWQPFASDPDTPTLSSHPQLVNFQVIFTGTTDLMPGVSLANSQVTLTGAATNAFYHISTNIARGSATGTGIQVITSSTSFNATHHTLGCAIHTTAKVLPSTTNPPVVLSDGVTTQHIWQFTTGATSISNYQVELTGTTDGTGDNYVVSQRTAYGK